MRAANANACWPSTVSTKPAASRWRSSPALSSPVLRGIGATSERGERWFRRRQREEQKRERDDFAR